MAYHVLADLVPQRVTEADLVQLTNDDVDATTVDTAVYEAERDRAESEIDAFIGARYRLPLETTPAVIKRLSMDLTVHGLYERRFREGVPEGIAETAKSARRMLDRLADGTMTLGIQPAATVNAERKAMLTSSAPTFSRDSLKGF